MNPWSGGPQPVSDDAMVIVKHRNGVEVRAKASAFDWTRRDAAKGRFDPAWDIKEWDEWSPAQPGATPAGE